MAETIYVERIREMKKMLNILPSRIKDGYETRILLQLSKRNSKTDPLVCCFWKGQENSSYHNFCFY